MQLFAASTEYLYRRRCGRVGGAEGLRMRGAAFISLATAEGVMDHEAVKRLINEKNEFSKHLGIEVVEVSAGAATCTMTVCKEHLNLFGTVNAGGRLRPGRDGLRRCGQLPRLRHGGREPVHSLSGSGHGRHAHGPRRRTLGGGSHGHLRGARHRREGHAGGRRAGHGL